MLWPSRRERIARTADSWVARSAGTLSVEDRTERDRWRVADPAHETAWQNARSLMAVTDGMPRPAATHATARSRHFQPVFAAAAIVAVIAAAGGAMMIERQREGHLPATATDYAATGQTSHFRLADGTMVDLDPASDVRADFHGPIRSIVLEHGTARFDVAHDASHPFVVTAADRQVTAIGTRFEVALRPRGVAVTLFQGAIEVAARSAMPDPAPIRMTRGQRLVVDGGRTTLEVAPPSDTIATGPRDVAPTSAGAIVAEANRTAAIPIRFANPTLGLRAVQGRFDTRDTAALAAQLGAALDLVVQRTDDAIILSKP